MPSSTPGPNAAGFDERLEFVRDILETKLKLLPDQVQPIAYDDGCPFPYNNFIFLVETSTNITANNQHGTQAGTCKISKTDGLKKFIFRLPNSTSGYNNRVRVENEVAFSSLVRDALRSHLPDLVPNIYAWESAADGKQGWILQEFMPGKSLQGDFYGLDKDAQQVVLEQFAEVLNCLQKYQIPSSVKGYGGLGFNEAGEVVIGPMTLSHCEPVEKYDDLVLDMLRRKFVRADKIPRISGWRENGIRSRLEQFLENGFEHMLSKIPRAQRLVHADLTIDNLHYDPSTLRLTAVLDFDFGFIGTVADEFFWSLGPGIGNFPSWRDEATRPLTEAMMKGFPNPLPTATESIEWPAAKMWDDALRKRPMSRPSNVPGIESLSEVYWLRSNLVPFKLAHDSVANRSGPNAVQKWKKETEQALDQFLKDQGF